MAVRPGTVQDTQGESGVQINQPAARRDILLPAVTPPVIVTCNFPASHVLRASFLLPAIAQQDARSWRSVTHAFDEAIGAKDVQGARPPSKFLSCSTPRHDENIIT